MVPGALGTDSPWRKASTGRGRTCPSKRPGIASRPVGIAAKPEGRQHHRLDRGPQVHAGRVGGLVAGQVEVGVVGEALTRSTLRFHGNRGGGRPLFDGRGGGGRGATGSAHRAWRASSALRSGPSEREQPVRARTGAQRRRPHRTQGPRGAEPRQVQHVELGRVGGGRRIRSDGGAPRPRSGQQRPQAARSTARAMAKPGRRAAAHEALAAAPDVIRRESSHSSPSARSRRPPARLVERAGLARGATALEAMVPSPSRRRRRPSSASVAPL